MAAMMRLVTQFDDRRMRATVATPTCCCCCCCCVASVVSTTVVTVLNVSDIARDAAAPPSRRWLYGIAAAAALPIALLAAGAANALTQDEGGLGTAAGLLGFFAIWTALLVLLYRQAGLPRNARPVGVTVLVGTLLAIAEFWVAALLLFAGEGTAILYLLVAVGGPFLLVPLLRRMSVGRR